MTTEQAQVIIDTLKVRIFDVSEAYEGVRAQNAQYEKTLSRIIELVGLTPDESGVKLEAIIGAVEQLVLKTTVEDEGEEAE